MFRWLLLALLAFAGTVNAQENIIGSGVIGGVSAPPPTYSGLGDTVNNATGFWSCGQSYTRAYASANGNLCNIENLATSEICTVPAVASGGMGNVINCSGSSSGDSVTAFCAESGSSCVVVELFDQSGNGNNFNSIPAAPGLIVNCINTHSCLSANSGDSGIGQSSPLGTYGQPFTFVTAAIRTGGSGVNSIAGCGNSTGSSNPVQMGFDGANELFIYAGTVVPVSGVADGVWHTIQYVYNGASSDVDADGVTTSSLNPGASDCTSMYLWLASGGNSMVGDVGELALYSAALTAPQQAAICHNQNVRYGLGLAC
jgi:hypothetical protein